MKTQTIARYFHTLRYLRPIQISGRLWHLLNKPKPDQRPAPRIRPRAGKWVAPARRMPSMVGPYTFNFLNAECSVRTAADWNEKGTEKLWRLNLHYLDDLNALGADARANWHHDLIHRWIGGNPPVNGIGWEAYPTSLRIVNWIKWALAGNTLTDEAHHSLAVQTRNLSKNVEWHLLGNHLLANAKGLVFAGIYFCGPEADRWLKQGLNILRRELDQQILDDGGHFERSPMYHSIVLEDLLDIHNLSAAYFNADCSQLSELISKNSNIIQSMRRWLQVMCHPDRQIAFFNDAAFGIAPCPSDIDEYARRLQFGTIAPQLDGVTYLANSGYVRLQKGRAVAILDVGAIGPDYIPGHAHADTLSFELSVHGSRVIVNSGTSTYMPGLERCRQRGTAAHSALVVDCQDSSEVWGSFRVARRARIQNVRIYHNEGGGWTVAASHDGYNRLDGEVIHQRVWTLADNELRVDDSLFGSFDSAVALFHLHPDVCAEATSTSPGSVHLRVNANAILWTTAGAALSVQQSQFHPEFGVSVPNVCLRRVSTKNQA